MFGAVAPQGAVEPPITGNRQTRFANVWNVACMRGPTRAHCGAHAQRHARRDQNEAGACKEQPRSCCAVPVPGTNKSGARPAGEMAI